MRSISNASRKRIEELESQLRLMQEELRVARDHSRISSHDAIRGEEENTSATEHSPSSTELPVYHAAESLQLDWSTGSLVFMNPTSIPRMVESAPDTHVSHWLSFTGSLGSLNESASSHIVSTREETEDLLDLYFTFLNGYNTSVDESTFRRDLDLYTRNPQRSYPAYSPCLHMGMLAVASHISTPVHPPTSPNENAGTKGLFFLRKAFDCLEHEIANPKPATVTGINLMSCCLADLGRSSVAWVYDGIAVRLLQDLGCHVDPRQMIDQGLMTAETYDLRANAFWTANVTYSRSRLAALYNGRMPTLMEGDYNLPLPKPSTGSSVPGLADLQVAFVSLSDVCADIIRSLYGFQSAAASDPSVVTRIQHKLQAWSGMLPVSTRLPWDGGPRQASPQVLAIHATYNTLSIIFHKSFLRRHCLNSEEGRTCFQTALSTVKLAKTFDLTYTINKAPVTMSQNLYIPGTVLTLILADLFDQPDKDDEKQQAQKALDDIISLLSRLSNSWRCSLQALEALKTMGHNYAINRLTSAAFDQDLAGLEIDQSFDIDSVLNFDWTTFHYLSAPQESNLGANNFQ
uniref:Xylanolytic transcriptional activator regulatory domain-containing protein n=1 Tax=Kwoniella dejecticola CBS 10117 TaxID=1296121 RepID=A0A1A6AAY6_9TREE|nr:uncharacterized protein I303_03238 [Kwoniella dejecticola CBS 10117]OBR87214.1 hypothetical protein I303_03238 [Kwoniella dejecticola CBS 10117]